MAVREKGDPFLIKELWSRVNQNGDLIVPKKDRSRILANDFADIVTFITEYNSYKWKSGSLHLKYNHLYNDVRLWERVFQGPEVEWYNHSPPLNYDEVIYLMEKCDIEFFVKSQYEEWIKSCKQERSRA